MESHDNNPYSPPKSKIADRKNEKGSPKKAVIVACAVDIFGTIIISVILGFIYGIVLSSLGLSQKEIASMYSSQGIFSPLHLINLVCGISITIFAGYLCAKIGRCTHYNLVTTYLVVVTVLVNFASAIMGEDISSIKNIVLTTLSVLAGYFGAWLYIREK